jgi:Na+/H+ antiporter NhaD/arsenite permease-like protein
MTTPRHRRVTTGIVLIVIGTLLYVLNRVQGIGQSAILLVLGSLFLAGYLYRRHYGLLIPAGVLLGLGAGSLGAQTWFEFGEPALLGLGAGFVSIFLIALLVERKSHWWPLIPGGVLILLGLPETEQIVHYVFDNWPLILVAVGLIILLSSLARQRAPEDTPPDG